MRMHRNKTTKRWYTDMIELNDANFFSKMCYNYWYYVHILMQKTSCFLLFSWFFYLRPKFGQLLPFRPKHFSTAKGFKNRPESRNLTVKTARWQPCRRRLLDEMRCMCWLQALSWGGAHNLIEHSGNGFPW